MDISGIGQANGIDYIAALTNRRNRSYANQTRSSASNADTVSISGEAMEKYLAMKNVADKQEKSSEYLAGMGEAPSGVVLTPDGGVMSPTSGTASSLSQIYFMNRFPEREEEELLIEKDESSENENSSNAATSVNDGQTIDERATRKVAMYKLADYIVDVPRNTTIIERTDVAAATKTWIDVPFEIADAMVSNK